MEGGDERAGVTRCSPSSSSFVPAAEPHHPRGLDEHFASTPKVSGIPRYEPGLPPLSVHVQGNCDGDLVATGGRAFK